MTIGLGTTPGARRARSALGTLTALLSGGGAGPRAVIPTGFAPLDEVLEGGCRPGDVVLVGGKPGAGKTVAVLQWARNMAAAGSRALFACYEHDEVTLLTRLLLCELGEEVARTGCDDQLRLDQLRGGLRAVNAGRRDLGEVLDSDPLLASAHERLTEYGARLALLRPSGTRTGLPELREHVQQEMGEHTILFVDYLQKVPVHPEPAEEAERVKRVAEGLKEMALSLNIAIVSVAAADRTGLDARRLRLHHFRGSTALAYEADVAMVLNNKIDVVSKVHLAYDLTRAAEFRRYVVFSVEKNRNGAAGIDLEFSSDFAHYRFEPSGRWVAERLWEEGTVEE
ncbi:MAG: DnaB-like helicase C-terminal domain-containing protein [Acidimicrobiales bacterium]